jgi:hypothetical protein
VKAPKRGGYRKAPIIDSTAFCLIATIFAICSAVLPCAWSSITSLYRLVLGRMGCAIASVITASIAAIASAAMPSAGLR